MALHQVDHVLDQKIALYLHDRRRRWPDEEHQEVVARFGSLDGYLWSFVDGAPIRNHWHSPAEVPVTTAQSDRMSRELKRRGFRFVGSTICYAFMQATGMVDDHLVSCFRHGRV